MADSYQYIDLPQVPDERCVTFWQHPIPEREYAGPPSWGRSSDIYSDEDTDYNEPKNNDFFQAQCRYRSCQGADASLFNPTLFHPSLDRGVLFNGHQQDGHGQEWHFADHSHRNGSPDSSSVSGSSSYATQHEFRSPYPAHSIMYKSPLDFPREGMSYPTPETMTDGGYPSELDISVSSNTINMKDIHLHREELDAVGEEQESVDAKPNFGYEQEPLYTEAEAVKEVTYEGYTDTTAQRDAESVEPMPRNEESDSDYKPGQKGRKRRSSASSRSSGRQSQRRRGRKGSASSATASSNRVNKKSRGPHASLNASQILNGPPTAEANTPRAFPCPLAKYGCTSTFASKNEWKRHVSTQHIRLGFWRCDLCAVTVDPHDDRSVYHNDFNRKDLFTQHLRRMHADPGKKPSRDNREYPVNEDNLAAHQKRCYQTYRQTPPKSSCLFCEKDYAGHTSWDQRMEHVGRHLEKEHKGTTLDITAWREDEELEQWLVSEGLITRDRGGHWKLGDGKPLRDLDDDSQDDV